MTSRRPQGASLGKNASTYKALPAILRGTPMQGVLAHLNRRQSFAMQLLGTSSGDEQTEWFGLLGKRLAQTHDYSVIWRVWSDTYQRYTAPSYIATGSAGERYLDVNGSRFINASPSVTGDIDVVMKIKPTSWTTGTTQILASKFAQTGNQMSWYFAISPTGKLMYKWYPNGSTSGAVTITGTVTMTATDPIWVRLTHDVDNGESDNDVVFYTSTDGTTWTQSGNTVTTSGTTSRWDSIAPYQVGSFDLGIVFPYIGRIYWVEIRNGIDTGSNTGIVSVVPPLLERWDCTNPASKEFTIGGSPVIYLHNGSRAAQQTTYFYDPVRAPLLCEPCDPSVIFLSAVHNDAAMSNKTFIDRYKLLVAVAKLYYPDVPIVIASQPPMKIPKGLTECWADAHRGAVLGTYAASTTGVYYYDLYNAIKDTTDTIVSDGIHPSAKGSAVWRDYVLQVFFGKNIGVSNR